MFKALKHRILKTSTFSDPPGWMEDLITDTWYVFGLDKPRNPDMELR